MARRTLAGTLATCVVAATACIPFNFGGTLGADRVWIDPDTGAWYREGDPDPIWTGPPEPDDDLYIPAGFAVPADYDGDGLTDPAVYLDGVWTIEGIGEIEWPAPGPGLPPVVTTVPVPADYDGDGDDDLAFYNSADGTWYVRGHDPVAFGGPAHVLPPREHGDFDLGEYLFDIALPGDYDGDGIDEMAVWQMDGGAWIIDGEAGPVDPGWPPGLPMPADYTDAPGLELGLWDPVGATWYIEGSEPLALPAFVDEMRPTALHHDADGAADLGFVTGTGWVVSGWATLPVDWTSAVTGLNGAVLLYNALVLTYVAEVCADWFEFAVGKPWEGDPPGTCT